MLRSLARLCLLMRKARGHFFAIACVHWTFSMTCPQVEMRTTLAALLRNLFCCIHAPHKMLLWLLWLLWRLLRRLRRLRLRLRLRLVVLSTVENLQSLVMLHLLLQQIHLVLLLMLLMHLHWHLLLLRL
eukprot:COSAG05_NODE_2422_length_3079_cov_19.994336_4_plen_129_part_00